MGGGGRLLQDAHHHRPRRLPVRGGGGRMTRRTYTDDELIALFAEHRTNRGVAEAAGLNIRTVERRRSRLVLKGWSPEHDMTRTVPDGFRVKGVSTLYRDDGTVAAQWVKSQADAERQREILQAAVEAMSES